jgi:hypothetical protein
VRTSDARRLEEVAIDVKTMAQYLSSGGRPTEFFAVRVMDIADELERLTARWQADWGGGGGEGGRG